MWNYPRKEILGFKAFRTCWSCGNISRDHESVDFGYWVVHRRGKIVKVIRSVTMDDVRKDSAISKYLNWTNKRPIRVGDVID